MITLYPEYRFCVYEHKIQRRKELASYRMIVLKNRDNRIACFTGLEQFSYPFSRQGPKITVRQKAELTYICNALNFIFSHNRVQRVADITADMVIHYFDAYCTTPKGQSEEVLLSQQSLDNCVRYVTSFFCNIALNYQTKIRIDELMVCEDTKANRHSHRIIRRYVPRYVPKRPHSRDVRLLRDMPLDAARRLLELAWMYDPMIAFGIALQLYGGLRPGCVVNMRQNISPVSPTQCIRLSYTGSAVTGIEIDLSHEYVLRSDGVSTGRIKKERVQSIYKPFVPHLLKSYRLHMDLLSRIECEPQYMPMFVGTSGKAMTYSTYTRRVKRLVYDYLKPELYQSEDPALSSFAHLLDSYSWAPHTLRHCHTVQLVLEGQDVAQIQFYRGDHSPESALAYVASKGELMEQIKDVHQKALETLGRQNISEK